MTPIARCGDCAHGYFIAGLSDSHYGWCRRYAPRPWTEDKPWGSRNCTRDERAAWPRVEDSDWCGEFVVRGEAPR